MRPIRLVALSFVLAALPGLSAGDAVITGRVTLPKARTRPVMNQRYEIVSKEGVMATDPPLAVVYLAGTFAPAATPPAAQVEQKDLMFQPALLPVQVGTIVAFPNRDDTYHNIFSYSAPKRFDLGRYRPDEKPVPTQKFDTPGLVTLRCDIHDHMRGLILVLDTPHFVVTDAEGRYRMEGLPAGHFVLSVWLDSRTLLTRPVDLTDGATQVIDFP